MNEQSVRLNYILSLVKLSFPCPMGCMHTTVDFWLLSTYRNNFWWRENVLGTVWYIFRFQDGYELPEHGGLSDLFVLEADLLPVGTAVILPHWSEFSMKMWFLVFRRHWVAGAGSECRTSLGQTAPGQGHDLFCVLQITNFKYSAPVHFVLFYFAD